MQFLTSLVALLSLGSSFALAAPNPSVNSNDLNAARRVVDELDSIVKRAEDKGIDIHGPIPTDYTSYNKTDGAYTFSADSKAGDWVRAQIALAEHPDSRKRQWANIGIGMFAQDWCNGQGSWFDNVQYNVHHFANLNMYSVGISYRGLRNNEHLDFSKLSGSDWCGTYVYSAAANTGIGCWNSQAINCFRLWTS